MPTIKQNLAFVSTTDREFVGTVAFKNEKLCLPNGSKVALGIDGSRWVIVFQEAPNKPFTVYEYSADKQTILVDKKYGGPEDIKRVRQLVAYFFENTQIDDVVTIEPGGID